MFGGKDEDAPTLDQQPSGRPETIIGPSVRVDGNFRGEGDVAIDGEVKGSIKTKKHLRIGAGAKVKANVEAAGASIAGEVVGNTKIKGELRLASSAKVHGDIEAKIIEIAAGAKVNGQIKMEIDGLPGNGGHNLEVPNVIKEKTKKPSTRKRTNKK